MWTVDPEPLESPVSEALLYAYFADIVERYFQRAIDPAEVDEAMEEYRLEGLAAFLVARWDGEPAGCVGLRADGAVTRMYIAQPYRRRGGARLLLRALEAAAREQGMQRLRLDTREDLVEAQALYVAEGFVEVEPWKVEEYADRFFEKHLT
ncbi:GNAT family N-acetyltransferase [Solirubrobacter taibaiensis]|nr:GNAT family N-acetyltransferase [Solirubrobacter taibaiensis]